ncbi:hypothetical protein [Actinokineospora diospyrosa]|uniref:PPE family protein n=1 Tax=Actinokineospora diospyrosa TaxID=103728 RepID=A0ABT1IH26_9PSEU|nr:hypothetical protein [Actinokineospora diospyrosa]MCP2271937.1 hypothetical protein [Actinokineospora diospyrosa]
MAWFKGLTGEEIYANFHNGAGTRPLERAAETVAQVAQQYGEVAGEIAQITRTMEEAWSGAASGAAMRGAEPLEAEHDAAASELTKVQSVTMDQVALFNGIKRVVQPIPPMPQQPGWWDNLTTFGRAALTYEAETARYNTANKINVDAMRVYEDQTTSNASAMPTSFGATAIDRPGVVETPPTPPAEPVPPTRVRPPVPVRNRVAATHEPVVTRAPARSGTEQQRVGTGEVQAHQQQRTDPSQVAPRPPAVAPRPGPNPGQLPGYPPPGVRPPVVVLPPVRMPGGGSTTGSVGTTGGRFGGGGGQPGQQGAGSHSGQRVPTGTEQGRGFSARGLGAEAGRGFGAEAGRGFGPEGARTGVGPTEGVRGSGVSEGARGAGQGRAGGGLPTGGGGAAGPGEDDLERSAPAYLVVPDPEALFGTDAVTAPPVIGE